LKCHYITSTDLKTQQTHDNTTEEHCISGESITSTHVSHIILPTLREASVCTRPRGPTRQCALQACGVLVDDQIFSSRSPQTPHSCPTHARGTSPPMRYDPGTWEGRPMIHHLKHPKPFVRVDSASRPPRLYLGIKLIRARSQRNNRMALRHSSTSVLTHDCRQNTHKTSTLDGTALSRLGGGCRNPNLYT